MHTKYQRGFVALMSVIIISAILLMYVFTLGISSFFNRFDVLDGENKRTSLGLAEACVSASMLRVAKGTPANNVCINSPGGACGGSDPQKVCKICRTVSSGGFATTTTHAVWNGSYSTLQVVFDTTPGSFKVTNWRELSTFDGTCTVP